MCELSEFAYETKCFKYWKNEEQSSSNVTMAEFADCMMIVLCFCDLANIEDLELRVEDIDECDIVKLFIKTNKIASSLTVKLEKENLLEILSYLIRIIKLLDYSDEEISFYCTKKMNETLKMISGK